MEPSTGAGSTQQTHEHGRKSPTGRYLASLSLAALGIVYGDIGTSPLYAVRECFHGEHAFGVDAANVLGVLSLILWSLIVVISIGLTAFFLFIDVAFLGANALKIAAGGWFSLDANSLMPAFEDRK